nr:LPS assembly lipoprotein LptE [Roseomonas acroporae]
MYAGGGEAGSPQRSGPITAELAKVRVGPIPERSGQLLKRSLENHLTPTGADGLGSYELNVSTAFNVEPQGFRRDGTPSRLRYTATATWSLFDNAAPPNRLAGGMVRSLDAFNLPDQQYFAADMSREAMERRLMESLSEQIVERVAVALERRRQPSAA